MAPKQQTFEPDLKALGFKITGRKKLIVNSIDGKYFNYFCSESDEVNDRRKEAMHKAVRKTVAEELKKYDINPLYLVGTAVHTERPEKRRHVTLLATDLGKLRKKKNVIVVVGDAGGGGQDGGIWAYRVLMRSGGITHGSLVGMAEELDDFGKDTSTAFETHENDIPGVVVLNPGQLLYSYKEGKSMTQTTWNAREKEGSLSEGYEIDKEWNLVPLHTVQNEHINCVLRYVLPQLLTEDTRIHMICMGDTVKDTVDCLDEIFFHQEFLAKQLEHVALIEPNHNPDHIVSRKFRDFLANSGRSFVESCNNSRGGILAVPKVFKPEVMPIHVDKNGHIFDENDGWLDVNKNDGTTTSMDMYGTTSSHQDTSFADKGDDVSALTVGAGDHGGVKELIFPVIMQDVLDFFGMRKMGPGGYGTLNRPYHGSDDDEEDDEDDEKVVKPSQVE